MYQIAALVGILVAFLGSLYVAYKRGRTRGLEDARVSGLEHEVKVREDAQKISDDVRSLDDDTLNAELRDPRGTSRK